MVSLSNRPECKNGFPLEISLKGGIEDSTKLLEIEFSPDQIRCILDKLDWSVLVESASQCGLDLPPRYTEQDVNNDIFLRGVHDAVIRFQIMEADLVCPRCNFRYSVSKGIANMLNVQQQ
ncbi:Trm112p family domain-containing protein [Cryptosporidium felis]|nr:Trm112p family domain-containing protein [Cryptosporidium felis]